MIQDIKLLFSLLIIGVVADYVWIAMLAKNFYLKQLASIGRFGPNGSFDVIIWAAIAVYVLISLGITFFVLPKVAPESSYLASIGWGFLFGVVVYGVYDFTNYSTVASWTPVMCVVDILWGGVLCGFLTSIGKYLRDVAF